LFHAEWDAAEDKAVKHEEGGSDSVFHNDKVIVGAVESEYPEEDGDAYFCGNCNGEQGREYTEFKNEIKSVRVKKHEMKTTKWHYRSRSMHTMLKMVPGCSLFRQ